MTDLTVEPLMDETLRNTLEDTCQKMLLDDSPQMLEMVRKLIAKGDSPNRIAVIARKNGASPVLENVIYMAARAELRALKGDHHGSQ